MKPLTLHTHAQLASHLRSFRKSRGFTQAHLGQLVGLDQTRIARIEQHPDRVSVGMLLKLLTALQVKVLLQPADSSDAIAQSTTDW
jgi:transcriptional regulator with XRE-family HTH domain